MFLVDEEKGQLVSYVADGGKTIRIPRTAGIAGASATPGPPWPGKVEIFGGTQSARKNFAWRIIRIIELQTPRRPRNQWVLLPKDRWAEGPRV